MTTGGAVKFFTGARRRRSAVAGVTALALVIAGLAATYPGFSTTDVHLNDGGVWVTKPSAVLVGHLNHQAQVLDGGLTTKSNDFDIVQSAGTVLAYDKTNSTLTSIDPVTVSLSDDAPLPAGAQVALGASSIAILDPASGELFVSSPSTVSGFTAEGTKPLAKLGANAAVAVGPDGTVRAVSPAKGQLVTLSVGSTGIVSAPVVASIAGLVAGSPLSIAAVGAQTVVFDAATGTLYLPGGKTAVVKNGKGAALQSSGETSDSVIVETATSLVVQPLDGGAARYVDSGGTGTVTAPVFLGGCAYGAWTGSSRFIRDCGGEANDVAVDIENLSPTSVVEFRVNRSVVVLNDIDDGTVWLVDQDMIQVENWDDVTPPPADGDDDSDSLKQNLTNTLPDRSEENHPPIATDDTFGVRAGRSTILPVLDNDSDPDGDMLTAQLDSAQPSLGDVQLISGGAALQIAVPEGSKGTATFGYRITDGRGGEANASITVRVSDGNEPPAQKRASAMLVELGATAAYNVLPDWIDPDGDDVYLRSATATTDDVVLAAADGLVTFTAANGQLGKRDVTIVVSDGIAEFTGVLTVDVRPAGSLAPVANGDLVAATINRSTTVSPLLNDLSPSGAPLRLVKLSEVVGAVIVPDYAAGTFSFTASVAQDFYVQYLVTNGPSTVAGVIRIVVAEVGGADLPPVAVRDTALLMSGRDVLVDVLANDTDPSGGILVVQSVRVPENAGIVVALLEHRVLRITDQSGLAAPVVIGYTVSNGRFTAQGEVLVIPVPAPAKLRPPVAVDDSVSVRAGDYVTIPVLANDYHPDGDTITLSPTLVEPLVAPADGELFVAQNTLRFKAGDVAKTVYATYEVVDSQGQKDAGYVTIQILPLDAETNSPPQPKPITARVLAGGTVRIPVPLDGIDPDGDSVQLVGQSAAPARGRIIEVGQSWLVYEAYADSTGTDSFSYSVRDRVGASATAAVLVGIAQPGTQNQKPYAVKDSIQARPGRSVAVDVLANDTDPDGDLITLVADGLEVPAGIQAEVRGGRVVVKTPSSVGDFTIQYTAVDPFGSKAVGALQVMVSDTAALSAPIAHDDRVSVLDIAGKANVAVAVLENDSDPDGVADDLTVTVSDPKARVSRDGTVTAAVTELPQTIVYTVTDIDGLTASAFVLLPGTNEQYPTTKAGIRPIEVKSGVAVTIDIAQYIQVRAGKSAIITSADTVTAAHGNGEPLFSNDRTIVYASQAEYYGGDAVSFTVTDGASATDPAGLTGVIVIPITVLPPDNRPPTFVGGATEVAPGEAPVEVNLRALASDPDKGDLARLSFALVGSVPSGFAAKIAGDVLTVSAPTSSRKGTTGVLLLTISDGTTAPVQAEYSLSVIASTRPLATTTEDIVPEAHQGNTVQVAALANDFNPFPDTPLTLVSAIVETGDGTATVSGSNVSVTPAASFIGTMVVRYRVGDASQDADRQVEGRIRLTVQGKPDAPSTPTVTSIQDRTVVLSWVPSSNNGAEITGYTVNSPSGYSRGCASTTCTLDGLTNNVEYTFTVTATNVVGTSAPSPASASARPDARPDTPAPPTLQPRDGGVDISWATPSTPGSPVESYTLEISPAPADGQVQRTGITGNSYSWTGLSNGTSYTVRVQAHNRAPDPSDFSGGSAAAAPFGPLAQPGAGATNVDTAVNLQWGPPATNGRDLVSLTISIDGGAPEGVAIGAGNRNVGGYSETHSIVVTATDAAGQTSTNSASARSNDKPPPPPLYANVSQGAPLNDGTGRFYMRLNTQNFPAGNYSIHCFADGENGGISGTAQSDVPANGSIDVCPVQWTPGWVYIEVVGIYTTAKTYIP